MNISSTTYEFMIYYDHKGFLAVTAFLVPLVCSKAVLINMATSGAPHTSHNVLLWRKDSKCRSKLRVIAYFAYCTDENRSLDNIIHLGK